MNHDGRHGHDKMSDYQKPIRFVLFVVILVNTQLEGLLLPCRSSAEKKEIESAENISLFDTSSFKKPLWNNLGDNNQVSLIGEKSPLTQLISPKILLLFELKQQILTGRAMYLLSQKYYNPWHFLSL